jgi:hypothetical protein
MQAEELSEAEQKRKGTILVRLLLVNNRAKVEQTIGARPIKSLTFSP